MTPQRPLLETEDRFQFDFRRGSLNPWFLHHAWAHQGNDVSRICVITDPASRSIVGSVALSTMQIERAFLPKPQQQGRPHPVPALRLGQRAIDKDYQRQGHAAFLLLFALKTALHASETIGCAGNITHSLDDDLRGFYGRWGLHALPFDPRRAMFLRMVDLQRGFADDGP